MAEPKKRSLTLASRFDEVERVELFVNDLQSLAGFDDELFGNIMLALSEAVTNAIVHGNKEEPSKKVYLNARKHGNTLTISIKDEGEGFDPDSLPDPLKEENLLKEGGRGVYLIRQFADKVTYSENGTKITIEFSMAE